jgi:hypothetical protein
MLRFQIRSVILEFFNLSRFDLPHILAAEIGKRRFADSHLG